MPRAFFRRFFSWFGGQKERPTTPPASVPVDDLVSETEARLDEAFRALSDLGVTAEMGANGSASLARPDGVEAAASTTYGGFLLGASSTENFLLASHGDEGRLVAAVCQGNEKDTSTMVAGAIALSELHARICGLGRSTELLGDLDRAMAVANRKIWAASHTLTHLGKWHFSRVLASEVTSLKGIGASVTATAIFERRLVVAHVGECCAFLYRDGELERLTADHTLRAHPDYARELLANPERGDDHGDVVLRALGFQKDAKIDLSSHELEGGDMLIVGTSLLPKLGLSGLLREHASLAPGTICQKLTEAAPMRKRPDLAATWVVVKVPETLATPPR